MSEHHPEHKLSSRRRQTAKLMAVFFAILAVVAVVTGTACALLAAWLWGDSLDRVEFLLSNTETMAIPTGDLAMGISLIVALAMLLVTVLHHQSLENAPGDAMAEHLGAVRVNTRDPHIKREMAQAHRVLTEMSMAAGLRTPDLFVFPNDMAINAMAAGTPGNAPMIALTMGAMTHLDRDELAGVLAHELSHILHEDTLLFTRVMSGLHGLMALNVLGKVLTTSFKDDDGNPMPAFLTNTIAFLFGWVFRFLGFAGLLGGKILQASLSRTREHMADAQAARLTGHPEALARALKKIGNLETDGRMKTLWTQEAQHAFFANVEGQHSPTWASVGHSHPPLVERILALDPTYDPITDPIWPGGLPLALREMRTQTRRRREHTTKG